MSKKKRRRRKPVKRIVTPERWEKLVRHTNTRLMDSYGIDIVETQKMAQEGYAKAVRGLDLNPDTIFHTKWGETLLDAIAEKVAIAWDKSPSHYEKILNEDDDVGREQANEEGFRLFREILRNDESVAKKIRGVKPLKAYQYTFTAYTLYKPAFFWEMVMGVAYPNKYSYKEPRENEHIFHFMSTVTFRYQIIYRVLQKILPGKEHRADRHAICRMLPSSVYNVKQDREEERISAILLTELWLTGNNEFEIGSELREMFMQTDIDNIRADSIQFPYDAFHIHTSEEHLMFTTIPVEDIGVRMWVVWNQQRGSLQLQELTDEEDTIGDIWDRLPDDFWENNESSRQACREAFNLVCNLCLYLETQGAEMRTRKRNGGDKPSERNRQKLQQYAKKQYTPVQRILYPSLEEGEKTASTGSHTKRRRHWVRGHYRWQPYWPEGRDSEPVHERIWIEPHLRGSKTGSDDDSDSDTRTYKV